MRIYDLLNGKSETDKIDIRDMKLETQHLEYKGKRVRVYASDYFNSVIRASGDRELESKIIRQYGNRTSFNEWCLKNVSDNIIAKKEFSLADKEGYPIRFCFNGKTVDAYCLKHQDDLELSYICSSDDGNFIEKIIKHLRYIVNFKALHYISNDKRIFDCLNMEITQRLSFLEEPPLMVSNTRDKHCLLYVPLDREGESPTWDSFMELFKEEDRRAIKMWFLDLFTEGPKDKLVLYIEGEGNTGKSTMVNSLRDVMGNLFASLSYDRDDMARSGVARNTLLLSIPDNKNIYIMNDQFLFNYTGKDSTPTRSLYSNPSTDEMRGKIIITGNPDFTPKFNTSKTENRIRFLFCKMTGTYKELDLEARKKFKKEFYFFINKCSKEKT